MPQIKFKGKNIEYHQEGFGEVILLIHGFIENSSMWDAIASELSKTHQIVRLDLPGFGKSDVLKGTFTMTTYAECVHQLLIKLNIKKLTLIGHSMGGYVGLELAKICPNKITHFILFHSTAKADSNEKKQSRSRAISLLKQKQSVYLQTTIPFLFSEAFQLTCSAKIQKMINEAKMLDVNGLMSALKAMQGRLDNQENLKNQSFKKTLIGGALDPLLNSDDLIEEAYVIGAQYLELKHAGHMSHFEDPKSAIDMLLKLVN